MSKTDPIICFGQQPNGFFPKRFFYAKVQTARDLQKKIGGKIVFFYHDSAADYRETITLMKDKNTGEEVRINIDTENKIQKKYSPLYAKKIKKGCQEEVARKLPRFVGPELINIFNSVKAETVADFCLEMYKKMGLLEGIEVVRSGDKDFRMQADDLAEYFADVEYEGEIVRAEMYQGELRLHEGGGKYFYLNSSLPTPEKIEKWQKNPARDSRFKWMNSVIHATHYVAGLGEGQYLNKADFPEVTFVEREKIEDGDFAYLFVYPVEM